MYTPVHTHMTHTYMHAHTHTRVTQTGLVPLAVTFGSYFSHCIHKACTCARKHLHIVMVNSPYTIFVTNTYTHTYTHTLISISLRDDGRTQQTCYTDDCRHLFYRTRGRRLTNHQYFVLKLTMSNTRQPA